MNTTTQTIVMSFEFDPVTDIANKLRIMKEENITQIKIYCVPVTFVTARALSAEQLRSRGVESIRIFN
jgi:hypothetical protein